MFSLDYEKGWGIHQFAKINKEKYDFFLKNEPRVLEATLNLFEKYNIRATWAVVGGMLCDSWEEFDSYGVPSPDYDNKKLGLDQNIKNSKHLCEYFFDKESVQKILDIDGQDIGGHSFSHSYFKESGVKFSDFYKDTEALTRVFHNKFKHKIQTYVFPRNQIISPEVLIDFGIKVYRGNSTKWYDRINSNSMDFLNLLSRFYRFYSALSPFAISERISSNFFVPAGIFLRFGLPTTLWESHFFKIKRCISGTKDEQLLHLWWHPHNLCIDYQIKLLRLEKILQFITKKRDKGLLEIVNMNDI